MCKRLRVEANVSPFLSQTRSADQLGNRKYELNDTHVSLIEVNVNTEAQTYVGVSRICFRHVCMCVHATCIHIDTHRDAYPRVPAQFTQV